MKKGCVIAAIVVAVLGVLIAGGCYLMVKKGMNMATDAYITVLNTNPVVQEHLGEITKLDMDMKAMMKEKDGMVIFNATGSKANGVLKVQEMKVEIDNGQTTGDLTGGTLTTSDGQTYQLTPAVPQLPPGVQPVPVPPAPQ